MFIHQFTADIDFITACLDSCNPRNTFCPVWFIMMTSSNGNIFRVTSPLCESPVNSPHKGQWRGALMFFFYLRLNKRLNKQSRSRWFETPSRPLWRYCNVLPIGCSFANSWQILAVVFLKQTSLNVHTWWWRRCNVCCECTCVTTINYIK